VLWISDVFDIFLSLYLQVDKLNAILIWIPTQTLSWFSSILFTLKQTASHNQLYSLRLKPLSFPTMPYSVTIIVAMLTYQSTCGCVCQSVRESLTICFFIIFYLYIVISTQTSRYLVGYLPVKSTAWLLDNQRNAKPDTSTNSMFAEFQTYFLKQKLVFETRQLDLAWL
jgi:hypothetical protein